MATNQTKKYQFSAAHRLFHPELSDDVNFQIYGKCSNPNGHGHNYRLIAQTKNESKHEFIEKLVAQLHHKYLNYLDLFSDIITTAENLIVKIWDELSDANILRLDLHETDNNWVSFLGKWQNGKPQIILTHQMRFCASHFPIKNQKIQNLHGHNYRVQISLQGSPNENGMVINFSDVKRIANEKIHNHLDHKNLNLDILHFEKNQPTVENLAKYIWKILENEFTEVKLNRIKIFATDEIFATYLGKNNGKNN